MTVNLSVVHVITTIERGGAEMALLTLCKAQHDSGMKVTVVPLKGKLELENSFSSYGINVSKCAWGRPIIRQIRELRKLCTTKNLIHAHLPRAELLSRIAIRSSTFVVTRHNTESFWPSHPGAVSIILSRMISVRAKVVIAISESVKNFLIASHEVSLQKPCKVVYYGYQKSLTNYEQKVPISEESHNLITIAMVNRLEEQKNISTVIKSLFRLRSHGYRFKVQIAGEGVLLQPLKSLVTDLGLTDSIKFIGKVDNTVDFLRGHDLFILASKYEGFGLVLLEAMDAAVPIIASEIPAIKEVLGGHHKGLFSLDVENSLSEKIIEILENPEISSQLINQQNERLENFSISKYHESHVSIYKN